MTREHDKTAGAVGARLVDVDFVSARLARLWREIVGDVALGAAGTLGLKLVGAGLTFLMFSLATRNMSDQEFGDLAHWFSLGSFLATVAVAGQELLIVRSWGQYVEQRRPALAKGALLFGLATALAGGSLVSAALFAVGLAGGTPASLLVPVCLFVFTQTVTMFTSHATRAIVGLFSGDGVREFGWRLAIGLGLLTLVMLQRPVDPADFFWFGAAGSGLIALYQIARSLYAIPPGPWRSRAAFKAGEWSRRAFKMWTASILEATVQYWDVVLVGWTLSPRAGGAYFVATRIATVFSLVSSGSHMFAVKNIAVLYHGSRVGALREKLRAVAAINGVLVVGGFAFVLATGHLLLAIFGPAYADQYGLMILVSVGTAFVALGGPCPALLLLTGHESAYTRILAAGVAARCLLLVSLATAFGVAGAAAAAVIASIAVTSALTLACARLVRINPSIGAVLSKQRI